MVWVGAERQPSGSESQIFKSRDVGKTITKPLAGGTGAYRMGSRSMDRTKPDVRGV